MDKTLQFAKTKEDLIKNINQIIKDIKNPKVVREAFAEWLSWFKAAKIPHLDELKTNKLFYKAFTIPQDRFFAIQIWEKHPTEELIRCVKTLYANKVNTQYWPEKIVEKRKTA